MKYIYFLIVIEIVDMNNKWLNIYIPNITSFNLYKTLELDTIFLFTKGKNQGSEWLGILLRLAKEC